MRIGPQIPRIVGCEETSCLFDLGKSDRRIAATENNPRGRENSVRFIVAIADDYGVFAEAMRRGGNYRLQIQVLIGDVHSQKAVRFDMAKVELEGFQGNQMDGDGVTGEGIYCQHVEALRLLPFEGQSRIPQFDGQLRS